MRSVFLIFSLFGLSTAFKFQSNRYLNPIHSANKNLYLSNTDITPLNDKEIVFRATQQVLGKALGISLGFASSFVPQVFAEEDSNYSDFITTQSGLKYFDTKVGDGAVPQPGDPVRVHYTGWLDGFNTEKKFDSSYDRRTPLSFQVGTRRVIAGWDEALLTNFKVGGKRNVIIPPELGYGSRGAGGVIPPNATLYFSMELVGIGK